MRESYVLISLASSLECGMWRSDKSKSYRNAPICAHRCMTALVLLCMPCIVQVLATEYLRE